MRKFNAKYILGDWETAQAAAGTTAATATTLNADNNWIATVASANQGVILKAHSPGETASVVNAAATNNLLVYPPSGSNFNGATADLPVTLPAGRAALFFWVSNTKIAAFI